MSPEQKEVVTMMWPQYGSFWPWMLAAACMAAFVATVVLAVVCLSGPRQHGDGGRPA